MEIINGLSLASLPKGIPSAQVAGLLKEHGENKLPEAKPPSDIELFANQIKSPLVYVLLGAGMVTAILAEFADTAIIALAVFINTFLGFIQERKANNALAALKKMLVPYASVLRDGNVENVQTVRIVPGDVVLLDQGDKIPADGTLVYSNRFYASEAILTGESLPVEKKVGDKVYMGTIATGGKGVFQVSGTGSRTEMGKIAQSVTTIKTDTPLEKQLNAFSTQLSKIVLFLLVLVFILGITLGKDPIEVFKTSVAMAVSAIPEGLIVALTVVLAIGMQRILRRKGLVRNLKSAETLGGVTTICMDKTGTLTEGQLKVTEVDGDLNRLAEQVIVANDLDEPIVLAAYEWGKSQGSEYEKLLEKYIRIDSIPFDSNSRLFVSLNKHDDTTNTLYIDGAPEEVLARCDISEDLKSAQLNKIEEMSSKGARLLGYARKLVSGDKTYLTMEDTYSGFEWIGLLGFFDPVRTDVKESLFLAREAGIRLIVITGDYANTAIYIMNQLGINVKPDDVILGDRIGSMSDEDIRKRLLINNDVKIFARTRPDQKLRIVQVLKEANQVVAMMGDGVNDAPALSQADIGIVVGDASDVAKESSDLILLDSRFSTIVAAIEEGRGIFDNIRKVILYLMCDAYVEILLVLMTLALGLPLPITAAQILWVNIVSDGFPHLALTVDPKVSGLMKRGPRLTNEPLVSPWMMKLIGLVSITGALYALGVYLIVFKTTNDPVLARSATFASVGLKSLIYVFSVRTLQNSFWEQNPLANKWLILAVSVGLVFATAPFYVPPLMSFLSVVPLGKFWVYPIASASLTFLTIEVGKEIFGKHFADLKFVKKIK
ncbi:HAD-IC family P-type ATPase [candidate division WWE3 bacterium]|uniref:HAD-IC family P-type ATPase n=1 Tax=candidate division WWE3 bacterium TaxID=2053526 RepID=A0A7X9DKG8_UNCKA|nr:HAD-IC family P-type ATPase [candidate division WWE3 bacterium]